MASSIASSSSATAIRVVEVELLDDADEHVGVTRRFREALPVSLSCSLLQAMEPTVFSGTVELALDTVELS